MKTDQVKDKQDLVAFNVDYFNVLTSQIESLNGTCSVARPALCEQQVSDYFLDRERNRLVTAEAMINARKLADNSQLDKAKQLLQTTIDRVKTSISAKDQQTEEFLKDLQEAMKDMVSKDSYTTVGAKKMAWNEQKMTKQRSAANSSMTSNAKTQMKEAYVASKTITTIPNWSSPSSAPSSSSSSSSPARTTVIPVVNVLPASNSPSSPQQDQQQPPQIQSQPQPQQQPQLASRKVLQVGNSHVRIPDDQAEESKVTPGQKLVHDWTMYVRGSDISFIEKVIFTIHESFTPNVITVANAPFEISRKGWGFFAVRVHIFFNTGVPPVEVIHELSFRESGEFQEVIVHL